MTKSQSRTLRRQDELHDLADESTNGVFAGAPDESQKDCKKNHDLVNDYIKKYKKKSR